MKDKLLAALRLKYKPLGFSEEAILAMAAYLETLTTDEAQVDTSVNGVEPLLKGFQAEIDKRVSAAVAKAKEKPADPPTPPTPAPTPAPADDTPAWAKALIDSNKTLLDEVNTLKQGKTVESRKTQLETALKDAPDAFKATTLKLFGRMNFADDTDFNSFVEEIKTEAATAIQSAADTGLGSMGQPRRSTTGDGKGKQLTPEQAAAIVNRM